MRVEFPWKELGNGATVCDVAGGVGNISLQLAKAHPNLRLILQDLPERIQQAKNEVWPKECPEAIAERRITFEPLDFFASSPVPGCNVYLVRDIYLPSFLAFSNAEFAAEKHHVRSNCAHLGVHIDEIFSSHDWPDAESIKILSGVRNAMAPHSRVLVRKSYSNFTLREIYI